MSGTQKRVKPLWNRFTPTKAASHRKLTFTKNGLNDAPNVKDNSTRKPENTRMILKIVTISLLAKIPEKHEMPEPIIGYGTLDSCVPASDPLTYTS